MDAISDEALMGRVKGGEVGRAGLLFERYQQRIYHYFLRSLSNPHDAQDATQATFARLLSYRGSYRDGKKFSSWLFSIAVNQRNQQFDRRARLELETLEPVLIPDLAEGPIETMDRDQLRQRLRAGLTQLRPDDRDILSLYLWEERSYSELAEIYQSRVASLRVRVHRALTSLKQILHDSGGITHDPFH